MKQAFEQDAAPPSNAPNSADKTTPAKPKATPRKPKAAVSLGENVEGTPTSKRKRPTPKKTIDGDDEKFKPESDEEKDLSTPSKRAKSTKPKVTPKPRINGKGNATVKMDNTSTSEATTLIKDEANDEDDVFHDAHEEIEGPAEFYGTQADRKSFVPYTTSCTLEQSRQAVADPISLRCFIQGRLLRAVFVPC